MVLDCGKGLQQGFKRAIEMSEHKTGILGVYIVFSLQLFMHVATTPLSPPIFKLNGYVKFFFMLVGVRTHERN